MFVFYRKLIVCARANGSGILGVSTFFTDTIDMIQHPFSPASAGNLYLAEHVRRFDKIAIDEFNIPGRVLMKRAGRACFDLLVSRWPSAENVTVFCGGGNNGGDGYVIAALAAEAKIPVQVFSLVDPMTLTGDAESAFQYAIQENVDVQPYTSETQLPESGVIVDAILGIGLSGGVREDVAEVINRINSLKLPVVAVDVPSGLCADTGSVLGQAIIADATTTFIAMKLGLTTGFAADYVGDLCFYDLQVPIEIFERQAPVANFLDLEALLTQIPNRPRGSHKGSNGHLLVIGGATGFGGAALMSAEAAARCGSGLTSVVAEGMNPIAMTARSPEIMAHSVSDVHEMAPLLSGSTTLALGPGLGQSAWSEQMFQVAINANKPLVIDADGLNLLARDNFTELFNLTQTADCVLTPHPGEAARLLGVSSETVQRDRVAAAQQLSDKYNATVVLKGAGTVIVTRTDQPTVSVCGYGNPGMASGGMGDVLTGVIAALMAQGFDSAMAAQVGVALHSVAADQLAQQFGERGLLATDLIPVIRSLLNRVSDAYHG